MVRSFGDYTKKWLAYEAATAWNRGIPCNFFKTLIQLYLFCLFLYFWLTVSNRVSKAIFLDITFTTVGLWGDYRLKQGNPLQNLKFSNQIFFLVLLNQSKMLSEVRSLEIKWICRPIRQIQPETGEYLVFVSKY